MGTKGPATQPGLLDRANTAHIRQSRPHSGLGFQVKVLQTLQVFPLRSEAVSPQTRVPRLSTQTHRVRTRTDVSVASLSTRICLSSVNGRGPLIQTVETAGVILARSANKEGESHPAGAPKVEHQRSRRTCLVSTLVQSFIIPVSKSYRALCCKYGS